MTVMKVGKPSTLTRGPVLSLLYRYKRKGEKIYSSFPGDFRVQLPNGTGAKIPRILILRPFFRNFFIDFCEIGIANQRFSAKNQPSFKGNP